MAEMLLYVDDDLAKTEVVAERLRMLGYQVHTAPNAAEGLALFSQYNFDLAVVDYYMPGISGDLLALEMKNRRPEMPVILFSGLFTLSEMVVAFVDGFVSTSDDPDALLDKVAEVLKPKRTAKAS